MIIYLALSRELIDEGLYPKSYTPPYLISIPGVTEKKDWTGVKSPSAVTGFLERYRNSGLNWFADSGVGTVIRLYKRGKMQLTVQQFENSIIDYLDFVADLDPRPALVSEYDLSGLFTLAPIMRWREKYFIPFQRFTGITIVFGTNPLTFPYEVDMFLKDPNYRYVGLSSMNILEPPERAKKDNASFQFSRQMLEFIVEMRLRGKGVHGFAMVNQKILYTYPFSSVDSSTWANVGRFGYLGNWDSKGVRLTSCEIGRRALRSPRKLVDTSLRLNEWLIPVKGHLYRDHQLFCRLLERSALSYRKMQEMFTKYWEIKFPKLASSLKTTII